MDVNRDFGSFQQIQIQQRDCYMVSRICMFIIPDIYSTEIKLEIKYRKPRPSIPWMLLQRICISPRKLGKVIKVMGSTGICNTKSCNFE